MNKTLAIIGAGHLGLQIAHFAIHDANYDKVCFFDDIKPINPDTTYPVIGRTSEIMNLFNENCFDEICIGIGYNHLEKRAAFFNKLVGKVPFATLIHSSVIIDHTAKVLPGSVLYPGSTIDAHVKIGFNNIVNLNCTISHDTIIGDHNFLAPRVAIAGFSNIGNQCFLGINATVIDNLIIADKSFIGAGAVVINNIEKAGTYLGNPAKINITL